MSNSPTTEIYGSSNEIYHLKYALENQNLKMSEVFTYSAK